VREERIKDQYVCYKCETVVVAHSSDPGNSEQGILHLPEQSHTGQLVETLIHQFLSPIGSRFAPGMHGDMRPGEDPEEGDKEHAAC
jgi:hypothetical protein